MKRFLRAGERYALSALKNILSLSRTVTIQTGRQSRVIAVLLNLFLCIPEGRANFSATAGAVFSVVQLSHAQQQSITGTVVDKDGRPIEGVTVAVRGGGTAATDSIKPLQIGDTVPEYLWDLPLQVVNHPEGKETITLAEYRGKLIILDFWATWCGSCIAAMPAIANVQQQYDGKMAVIPVSRSEADATKESLLNHPILHPLGLLSIVGTDQLISAFPHRVVPFYVWIGPEGVVAATTSSSDVTPENVVKVLQGDRPQYELMTDIDRNAPLLLDQGLLPASAGIQKFSLLIRGHIPSLPSGSRLRIDGGQTVGYIGTNLPVGSLYYNIARGLLGPHFSRQQMEILADTLLYPEIHPISSRKRIGDDRSKLLSYEFRISAEYADSLYQLMLDDLNQCSGFHGSFERRKVHCYVLQRGPVSARKGQTGNVEGRPLLNGQSSGVLARILEREDVLGGLPVIDETGLNRPLTITVDTFDTLEELQAALRQYGLILSEAERHLPFFSISTSQIFSHKN